MTWASMNISAWRCEGDGIGFADGPSSSMIRSSRDFGMRSRCAAGGDPAARSRPGRQGMPCPASSPNASRPAGPYNFVMGGGRLLGHL